jgi:hypothetical protein
MAWLVEATHILFELLQVDIITVICLMLYYYLNFFWFKIWSCFNHIKFVLCKWWKLSCFWRCNAGFSFLKIKTTRYEWIGTTNIYSNHKDLLSTYCWRNLVSRSSFCCPLFMYKSNASNTLFNTLLSTHSLLLDHNIKLFKLVLGYRLLTYQYFNFFNF